MAVSLESSGVQFPDNSLQRNKDYLRHPANLGASYGGGYYIGTLWENGYPYWIITAPLSSVSSSIQFCNWTSTPSAYQGWNSPLTWSDGNSLVDGYSNTQALADRNGATNDYNNVLSFPAAMHCWNLSLNGYSDWYLPSFYELTLLHSARSYLPSDQITETLSSFVYYWSSSPWWSSTSEYGRVYFLAGNYWYIDSYTTSTASHTARPFRRELIS